MSAVLYINTESNKQDMAVSLEIPVQYASGGRICMSTFFMFFHHAHLVTTVISLVWNTGNPIFI